MFNEPSFSRSKAVIFPPFTIAYSRNGCGFIELNQSDILKRMIEVEELRQMNKRGIEVISSLAYSTNPTGKIRAISGRAEKAKGLLNKNQQPTLFRHIPESLYNVLKPALANFTKVSFSCFYESLSLPMKNNSIGIKIDLVKKAAGPKNVFNRVCLTNGSFVIETKADAGCKFKINLPI